MRRTLSFLCLCLVGCGAKAVAPAAGADNDAAVTDDATADAADAATVDSASAGDIGTGLVCGENWAQGYCIKFTFHGQKFDGHTFTLQRDLTGTPSTVVFGNTHMTPPAASLAIHDTWQLGPYKDLLDLNIVFGNLVTAPGFPAFVPKAADYPFACTPPYVDFSYGNIRYRSTCPGLAGDINVKQWTASPGEQFTGRFSGHLQQYLPGPGGSDDCQAADAALTCKSALNNVDIEGTFGLTLPALNAAVAP